MQLSWGEFAKTGAQVLLVRTLGFTPGATPFSDPDVPAPCKQQ